MVLHANPPVVLLLHSGGIFFSAIYSSSTPDADSLQRQVALAAHTFSLLLRPKNMAEVLAIGKKDRN